MNSVGTVVMVGLSDIEKRVLASLYEEQHRLEHISGRRVRSAAFNIRWMATYVEAALRDTPYCDTGVLNELSEFIAMRVEHWAEQGVLDRYDEPTPNIQFVLPNEGPYYRFPT